MNKSLPINLIQLIIMNVRNLVNAYGAIKHVDLALKVSQNMHPDDYSAEAFNEILSQMVRTGVIIEIEYVVTDNNSKSIYLPAGTKVTIKAK